MVNLVSGFLWLRLGLLSVIDYLLSLNLFCWHKVGLRLLRRNALPLWKKGTGLWGGGTMAVRTDGCSSPHGMGRVRVWRHIRSPWLGCSPCVVAYVPDASVTIACMGRGVRGWIALSNCFWHGGSPLHYGILQEPINGYLAYCG